MNRSYIDGSFINKSYMKGSLTVEAACVMAAVLLCLSVMIRQAGRVRDETLGAMCLHEAVEKGRHEKGMKPDQIASAVQEYMGRPMTFAGFEISLKSGKSHISGSIHVSADGHGSSDRHGSGGPHSGGWSREMEAEYFRPETFLRKITLIESLGEENGD